MKETEIKSFTLFMDMAPLVWAMDKETAARWIWAVFKYIDGEDTEKISDDSFVNAFWKQTKLKLQSSIEKAVLRSINAKKAVEAREAYRNQTISDDNERNQTISDVPTIQDNTIQDITNNNTNNTLSDKSDSVLFLNQVKDILTYLNKKAGTAYRASSKTTQQYIRARMKEGYTLEDFRTVINKKCAEWLGTDQAQYLRPETLFRPGHFESYLNQPEAPARQRPAAGQNRNRFMNFQQRSDQEHKNLVNAVIAQSMQH